MTRKGLLGRLLAVSVVAWVLVPAMGYATPAFAQCADTGWHYDISSWGQGTRFGQIGPTQSDYNGTGSKESVTLSYSASGTVSDSFSVSVTAGASGIIFSASATLDASISTSRSLTFSHSVTFSVPSHYYGNGGYGFFKDRFVGHSYYLDSLCRTTTDNGTVVYKAPTTTTGWCTWTSSKTQGAGGARPTNCQG
jgi:hypothetical protein